MKTTKNKIKFFRRNIKETPRKILKGEENIFESIRRLTWIIIWAILFFVKRDSKNRILESYLLHDAKKKIRKNSEKYKKFLKWDYYDFNGIKLPIDIIQDIDSWWHFQNIYDEILKIYLEYNDDYSHKEIDPRKLWDWPYCYDNNWAKILIEKWDVVIDAWAWIWDFSAYAAKKWAIVYAFEPFEKTFKKLQYTAELNKGEWSIIPIKMGLWELEEEVWFESNENRSLWNKINRKSTKNKVQITTLDSFVLSNNIKKIDFIKADIEWNERNMLLWSKWVLKNFRPKLSLCTYHLPDDRETLSKIIKDINPDYKILLIHNKLYAYI